MRFSVIGQGRYVGLILAGNYLMDHELQLPHVLGGVHVGIRVRVVHIVHLHFEFLFLFEMVLHHKCFYKDWIEVIHDDFCSPYFGPEIPFG
mmetsp:Transcript_6712/g.5984  ORF Transcript_6712/g.5984 Transcript_6712/m.5984 type:complete len:91 (+) Transcript_6712:1807-2079(+)